MFQRALTLRLCRGSAVELPNGPVYVLDARRPAFDAGALLALNDLGPAGRTGSANSLSCSAGRPYDRSASELLCFGTATTGR